MPNSAYLTKSRYAAGLQCPRRLWLNVYDHADWEDPWPGSPEDIGIEIGRMAHNLFPGGIPVEEAPWEHALAVARTAALMADSRVPTIFEAAFEHSSVRIRVDVLERLPRGYWGIREVKSSGEVKEHHYDDLAVQLHVLRRAGVRTSSVEILHVNKKYRRSLNGICWPKFFTRSDVKREAKTRLAGIEARLKGQLRCLARPKAPNVEPDTHCHSPYSCEHWARCTASKPADWVFYLPRLSVTRRAKLKKLEIESISAIPDDFGLSRRQAIIRDATRSRTPWVSPDLSDRLKAAGPPAHYLDFEAMLPAVPLYPGTRPFQTIPFQWSLHHVDPIGAVAHREFLGDPGPDPRRAFTETLLAALSDTTLPVIVYSSYEKVRLAELAKQFPDLTRQIRRVKSRLTDLLPVVRDCIYFPKFGFSNSIKSVAPALSPDVTYDDLEEIADGGTASTAFWLMASGRAEPAKWEQIQSALRAYCHRDTWALLRVHQALTALANK